MKPNPHNIRLIFFANVDFAELFTLEDKHDPVSVNIKS